METVDSFKLAAGKLPVSVMMLGTASLAADDKGGDDLRSAMQNPISSLYSLPFKFTFDYGADNGEASFLNVQPVMPVTVGDWNLVNRIIMPLIDIPGQVSGLPGIPNPTPGNGATGLGDINYSLFLSPLKVGKVIRGVGPSITMLSATDDQLGSEKWSAGPTAVFLTQPNLASRPTTTSSDRTARRIGTFDLDLARPVIWDID